MRCSICGYRSLSFRSIVRHLSIHYSGNFRVVCGLNDCIAEFNVHNSFLNHLRSNHPDIYDESRTNFRVGAHSFINLDDGQEYQQEAAEILVLQNQDERLSAQVEMDRVIPDLDFDQENSQRVGVFSDSASRYVKNFLESIVVNGFQKNVPFSSIKALSESHINLVVELLSDTEIENPRYLAEYLKSVVNSSERVDSELFDCFPYFFPKVIKIEPQRKEFVYLSLKKSIKSLVKNFESFDDFLYHPSQPCPAYESFFSGTHPKQPETIYISVFSDDFQLANPLLSRKSLDNQVNGIYIRLVSKNSFRSSKSDNVRLLAIVKTSTLSVICEDVFYYLSKNSTN